MEVHVTVQAAVIASFMDTDKGKVVCFRCGENGHARYQCLSYKIRLCSRYEEKGGCPDPDCSFAHGKEELRTPWKQRCVRVIKQEGRLVCIGCNSTEHTFRKCPLHQDYLEV